MTHLLFKCDQSKRAQNGVRPLLCTKKFLVLSIRAWTSLIRDLLSFAFDPKSNQPVIRKWVNHDSPTFDFFYSIWFLIRRWIMIRGWILIRSKSKSSRIKMNKIESLIKLNKNYQWIVYQSESKVTNQNQSIRPEPCTQYKKLRACDSEKIIFII